MNCATCGTALPNDGTCTVCNPWQAPAADPQAAGAVPISDRRQKQYATLANKYPAKTVDMELQIRKSATVVKVTAASFAALAAACFVLAQTSSTNDELSFLLFALPMGVNALAATTITRGGGWLGASISNLKLRPDIGPLWLFTHPEYRRMGRAFMVYFFGFLLFFLVRINMLGSTTPSRQAWFYLEGAVGLVMAAVQAIVFWKISAPLARLVQARLAEPAPATAPDTSPVQQTFGGAEALS